MSEVKLSELENSKRLDSEYYKKEYLNIENSINSNKCYQLSELAEFLIGPFGSAFDTANYVEDGYYRYVRGQDVKPFVLKDDDCRYIPESDYKRLFKYSLKEKDVLVSVVGTLGNACIVQKKDIPAIFSCKSTVIRAKKINPVVLLTYLNCEYGKKLLLRKERGAIQKGLNLDDLRTLLIPQFEENLSNQIESMFYEAQNKLEESKLLYSEAEDLLLSELGLKDWNPKKQNVSIKHFSDFFETGRLDAEYYQNKYDELFEHLSNFNCDILDNIVNIKKSVEPGSESYMNSGIPFIRVSDINKYEISKTDLYLSPKDFNIEQLKPHKDTILLSKDGSIGIAYKCQNDMDIITSGALLHLVIKDNDVLPDYLTLVLNSIVVQLQAERDSNGAIIQHWKPDEIKKVIIPKLSHDIQLKISKIIQKSLDLRDESKKLLDHAKQMVENEIEKVNMS